MQHVSVMKMVLAWSDPEVLSCISLDILRVIAEVCMRNAVRLISIVNNIIVYRPKLFYLMQMLKLLLPLRSWFRPLRLFLRNLWMLLQLRLNTFSP